MTLDMGLKQVVRTLVLIYFGSYRHRHTVKTNCIKFEAFNPEICSILIFQKMVWD